MKQIVILIVLLLAYFGIHYFVAQSVIAFFGIESSRLRAVLYGSVAFLAVSFIAMTFVVHWSDNPIARGGYFVSGVWAGGLINLFFASLVIWAIYLIAKAFGFHGEMKAVAGIFYFLAVAVSAWGVWNAFNPTIKNIDVQISNLPEFWNGKKIVQLSDIHLGNVLREGYMEKVAKMVDAEQPEAIFLTGDVFDGVGSELDKFILPLNHINAPQGIFYVTGNHETYLGLDKVFSALDKTKIKVLNDELVEVERLQIFGVSYPERQEKKDVGEILLQHKQQFGQKPTILLNHAPTHVEQAATAGVALQLSGHSHYGQIFPLGLITGMVYGKFDHGLNRIGDFSIHTSIGTGVWGPTMRTLSPNEITLITLHKK